MPSPRLAIALALGGLASGMAVEPLAQAAEQVSAVQIPEDEDGVEEVEVVADTPALTPQDPRLAPAAEAESQRRRTLIKREIARGGSDWGGLYYAGDGLGYNLSISLAPRSGYVIEIDGCTGTYARDWGTARLRGGRIVLESAWRNQEQVVGAELLPLRWGRRRYLVPFDGVADFCNSVNAAEEPRKESHGTAWLRRGDEKRPASGPPPLPSEFAGCLLPEPLAGVVTALGKASAAPFSGGQQVTRRATLSFGSQHGAFVGMNVYLQPPCDDDWGRVVEVAETSAVAEFERYVAPHSEPHAPIEAGCPVSTREPRDPEPPAQAQHAP